MDERIHKQHNKTLLPYHLVSPAKHRRDVFTVEAEGILKEACIGVSERYGMNLLEIGFEDYRVHFLVQSVPSISVAKLLAVLKGIAAKETFRRHKETKQKLCAVGSSGLAVIAATLLDCMQAVT